MTGHVRRVRIGGDVVGAMVRHAWEAAPRECCGLLAGDDLRIDEAVPCRNQREDTKSFFLAPEDLIETLRRLRREKRRWWGIYHSHPHGPETPSERDRREFYYPDLTYWIISLHRQPPVVRCFYWEHGDFRPGLPVLDGSMDPGIEAELG